MKIQTDRFLLGLLWLLTAMLGASFWFNIKYGFNLTDGAHWKYLGELQASGGNIAISFYVSLFVATFVALFGLYLLVRPRFRKINFKNTPPKVPYLNPPPATVVTSPAPKHEEELLALPPPPVSSPTIIRPPRLNMPTNFVRPAATSMHSELQIVPTVDTQEIDDTFSGKGYTVKNPPKFGKFKPTLWAIGADETLWIGAPFSEREELATTRQKVNDLFEETLDSDITITVKSILLNSPQRGVIDNVEAFENTEQLGEWLAKNKEISGEELENFNAFSEYIDTVANYFNRG